MLSRAEDRTELRGSRVLLTGASSGIGRELAKRLAAEGAVLAVAARRGPLLEELSREIQRTGMDRPLALETDLSVRGNAEQLAHRAAEALGHVDVLINNAGGGVGGSVWAVGDRDEGRDAFEVNFWSPLALIQTLVPSMRARGSGTVVNVTSIAHVMTWPSFGHYASTKGALSAVTESLRMELASSGVDVLEVIPGPVDTPVQGETRLIPGIGRMLDRTPLGDPAELAALVVRAIKQKKKRLIYPRRVLLAHFLPTVAREYAGRLADREVRGWDPKAREALFSLVVRSGSMGDPMARQAREEWERSRTKAHPARRTRARSKTSPEEAPLPVRGHSS